ncbi:MAG: hypothetical protein IT436_16430 [Phycisphaerales bacterium]|nr:hypothetical protein [Phycisphaerales bacterium]
MPRPRPLALLLVAACAAFARAQPDAAPGQAVRYDGHSVARITVNTARDLQAVTALADSVWSHRIGIGGEIDVQLAPGKLAALDELGLRYRVLIPDVQKLIDAETAQVLEARARDDLAWFQTYHNLAEINAYMDQLAAARPDLAQVVPVGPSHLGKPIRALRITGPDQPGNPKSARPGAVYHGCQHAREWISPASVMWFAEQFITKYDTDARIRDVVNNVEFNLIPVVNPDGYEFTWTSQRLWRKNRRPTTGGNIGVDTNRNWGYEWGGEGASTDPGSETYRGPSAFSEPETQAMRDFIIANPRFRAHIDLHSYSQLVMSPWGWTSALPPAPDAGIFAQLDAAMAQAILDTHGRIYDNGPVYTTIYPASGGSNDWTYGARGILGFAFELRDTGEFGFELPADQIIPTGEEAFAAIMVLSEHIGSPLTFALPDGEPSLLTPDVPSTLRITITDQAGTVDPATPAIYTRLGAAGPFTPALLTLESGATWLATLPGIPCGETLQYYFSAATTAGREVRYPSDAPTAIFEVRAYESQAVFADDFELAGGWQVGSPSDTATRGIWERADPQATAAQPGDDHTPAPGIRCYITDSRAGSAVGDYDVDGGSTTLTSPAFSALPASGTAADVIISYWRWYSNNQGSAPGQDSMPIQISADNGLTWTTLETVSENAGAWVHKSFSLADVPITPTAQMKFRFIARDEGSGSIIEAGIDDVQVAVLACSTPANPADLNGDGIVDFADYLEFLTLYDALDPRVDFTGDGIVDFADYLQFLNYYYQ